MHIEHYPLAGLLIGLIAGALVAYMITKVMTPAK